MKSSFLAIALALTLGWNPVTNDTRVTKYRLVATNFVGYTTNILTSNTSASLPKLPDGITYFTVSSLTSAGLESDPSPVLPVTLFTITVRTFTSTNLSVWNELTNQTISFQDYTTNNQKFYKTVMEIKTQ